ncbi:hypothetical protein BUALT_Bualt03G0061100 [Buddleja alternifolia]|uniref:GRF-type domain-containing protein n=1 Tax=Buddleja alternifolia TaxID=168488 RepID=A0AAV6XY84_9LAMI|nr:hypothetical protein BUALT_Bualt03G0061100 [Buddleja alternifolia]
MSTSSNNKSFKNLKHSLELRYASPLDCECFIQAQIRVVESERKPSKRRLYYACPRQNCSFFRWCKPYRAIWSPSGIPVSFPSGDLFSGAEEEVEDDDEVVSGVSRIVGSQRQEMRGNYVHFSWFNLELLQIYSCSGLVKCGIVANF